MLKKCCFILSLPLGVRVFALVRLLLWIFIFYLACYVAVTVLSYHSDFMYFRAQSDIEQNVHVIFIILIVCGLGIASECILIRCIYKRDYTLLGIWNTFTIFTSVGSIILALNFILGVLEIPVKPQLGRNFIMDGLYVLIHMLFLFVPEEMLGPRLTPVSVALMIVVHILLPIFHIYSYYVVQSFVKLEYCGGNHRNLSQVNSSTYMTTRSVGEKNVNGTIGSSLSEPLILVTKPSNDSSVSLPASRTTSAMSGMMKRDSDEPDDMMHHSTASLPRPHSAQGGYGISSAPMNIPPQNDRFTPTELISQSPGQDGVTALSTEMVCEECCDGPTLHSPLPNKQNMGMVLPRTHRQNNTPVPESQAAKCAAIGCYMTEPEQQEQYFRYMQQHHNKRHQNTVHFENGNAGNNVSSNVPKNSKNTSDGSLSRKQRKQKR